MFLTICNRIVRHLERRGLLVRDAEHAYLGWDSEQASALDNLAGHSITYTVAVGPNKGKKAFTLQTLPAITTDDVPGELANSSGFSLHAEIAARADQRTKLERLCRYVFSIAGRSHLAMTWAKTTQACVPD